MIVTLTPNPSLDRTIAVDHLDRGEVHRAQSSRVDPGGKGINVARALTAHGDTVVAVYPSGGPEGHLMADLLEVARVDAAPSPVSGTLRTNVTVVEPDGTTTKLNERGPRLTAGEHQALAETLRARTGPETSWLVGCGSLPPGLPDDTYAAVVALGRDLGVPVALDTSGAPLRAAVPVGPDLVKPNRAELEELLGRPLTTVAAVVKGAREVLEAGVGAVVVSLGRQGALAVTMHEVVHASARVERPQSTVGAGDALLAGFLHAHVQKLPLPDCLSTAVSWGAAAVSLPGSRMPHPEDVARIAVRATTDPDPDLATDD